MSDLFLKYDDYLDSEDFLFSEISVENIFKLQDDLIEQMANHKRDLKKESRKFAHIINHKSIDRQSRHELLTKTLSFIIRSDALIDHDFFMIRYFPHFIENDLDREVYRKEIKTLKNSSNEVIDFLSENLTKIMIYLLKKDITRKKEGIAKGLFEKEDSTSFRFVLLKSFFVMMTSYRDVASDYFLRTACEIIKNGRNYIEENIWVDELGYLIRPKERHDLYSFFDNAIFSLITQPSCGDMTVSYVLKNFESAILPRVNIIFENEYLLAILSVDTLILLRDTIFYNNIASELVSSKLDGEIYKRISSEITTEDERVTLLKYGL